jgi:hypothetical protein
MIATHNDCLPVKDGLDAPGTMGMNSRRRSANKT